ncbi:hypothetical protein BDK51DRAFT_42098 [Blyttiomyces helicus]|uniref:Uncharacterized protein n=1 Tax=Blyttiomyces helicus TaxID=388810 RepID=A0A4P9WGA1_9FUNG|nr:hypothetical protein BDK51DRAFT_42098 [Blyttiomyces helicus]|eukprot:RKO90378.1 hypothetical protein BDK51DRAFT_42098 [Blyttiomyces helicus]
MSDPVVLEWSEIILQKKTFEIVARGMDNICDIDTDQAMSYLDTPDAYALKEAEHGTVLRVSYIDNQWVVSTNRCIDATRARWSSSKTLYRLLCETVSEAPFNLFERDPPKDETHTFILRHPENQLVIHQRVPQLVYVGSCQIGTFVETSSISHPGLSWCGRQNSLSAEECRSNLKNQEMHIRRGIVFRKNSTSDSPTTQWKLTTNGSKLPVPSKKFYQQSIYLIWHVQ